MWEIYVVRIRERRGRKITRFSRLLRLSGRANAARSFFLFQTNNAGIPPVMQEFRPAVFIKPSSETALRGEESDYSGRNVARNGRATRLKPRLQYHIYDNVPAWFIAKVSSGD